MLEETEKETKEAKDADEDRGRRRGLIGDAVDALFAVKISPY